MVTFKGEVGLFLALGLLFYSREHYLQKAKDRMNTRRTLWMMLAFLSIGALALSGCYTEVGVTREGERGYEYANKEGDQNDQAVTEDDANNEQMDRDDSDSYDNSSYDNPDWGYRPRVGFSYYYPSYSPSGFWPSYAFNAAYANPWAGFGTCYAGSYYDPFWCGAPYVSYTPYWDGYYYGAGYYSPYYSYYPYYGGSGYTVRNVSRGTREMGSTRGVTDRGFTGGTRIPPPDNTSVGGASTLPTGSRNGGVSSSPKRGTSAAPVVGGSSRGGSTRGATTGTSAVTPRSGQNAPRGTSTRSNGSRVYRQRGSTSNGAPSSAPASRDGGTQSAPPRNSAPSYSPPPSSSPPSSGRGSAPASSGSSRGGSTRGGRPN